MMASTSSIAINLKIMNASCQVTFLAMSEAVLISKDVPNPAH